MNSLNLLYFSSVVSCFIIISPTFTETIKKECDAPTIGLLLCRGKNRVTVDWSLKSTNVPIGVSTYKLKEQLPKELIDKLPTEEEINLYLNVEEGED